MFGHIRKREHKDGTTVFQANYADPTPTDPTHKIVRTFTRRQDARHWLTQQSASLLDGTHIAPSQAQRPFSDVLDAWQESWAGRLSPTTALRYRGIIEKYLRPEFGHVPMAKITHEAVQRYITRLSGDSSIKPGTVRNVYAVLRTAFAKGVRMGLVRVNPCTDIDLPRPSREEMLFLTASEVQVLAEKIDPHYRVLIYTAAYTGMRAGELGGLQRRDVDLLRGVVHVRRARKDVNGRLELGPTKTQATRSVALPGFLKAMLEEHLTQAPTGSDTGPEAPVFTMKTGGLFRHGLFYGRYFRRAVAGYELRGKKVPGALPADKHGLRFHDLRHTCASLLINAGAHPLLVSKQLGHSSVTITLDVYSHLLPDVAESLAAQMDGIYHGAQAAPAAQSNVTELRQGG